MSEPHTPVQDPPGYRGPYVGPRAFKPGEALYARDREAQELLGRLLLARIVLLYSPSGAGKTSLLQARLIPLLEEKAFDVLPVIRVGLPPAGPDTANRYLDSTLLSLTGSRGGAAALEDALQNRPQPETGKRASHVLIFDQFEEVFTLNPTDGDQKQAFFETIGEVLQDRNRWAVFAMREEYIARLDPYLRLLPTLLATRYRLDLLGPAAARQAIQGPAQAQGVRFEDEAVRQLIDDLRLVRVQQPDGSVDEAPGPHVEPVQLQVVCRNLWRRLQPEPGRIITREDLQRVGDVNEALAEYYDTCTADVARSTGVPAQSIRSWIGTRLITGSGLRSQVLHEPQASQGLANEAIAQLVDAYLVRREERRGVVWYELSHDRLIAPVRARNDAHATDLQRTAAAWQSRNNPSHLLLRGAALDEAETLLTTSPEAVTEPERAFIRASRQAEADAEAAGTRAELRRTKAQRNFLVALSLLAGFVLIGGAYIFFLNTNLTAANQDLGQANQELARKATELEATIAEMNRRLELQTEAQRQEIVDQRGTSYADSFQTTPQRLQQVIAGAEIRKIPEESSRRVATTVQFYQNEMMDSTATRLEQALRSYGFRVEPRLSRLRAQPNTVAFGSEVTLEDVKLVALCLVWVGLEVKRIRRLENDRGRAQIVQILPDARFDSWAPLSTEEIRGISEKTLPLLEAASSLR